MAFSLSLHNVRLHCVLVYASWICSYFKTSHCVIYIYMRCVAIRSDLAFVSVFFFYLFCTLIWLCIGYLDVSANPPHIIAFSKVSTDEWRAHHFRPWVICVILSTQANSCFSPATTLENSYCSEFEQCWHLLWCKENTDYTYRSAVFNCASDSVVSECLMFCYGLLY